MSSYWDPTETRALLSLWGDAETQKKLESSRNNHAWVKILDQFLELGFVRSRQQIKDKINNLRQAFYKEKRKVDLSGEGATSWEFYGDLNNILGGNRLAFRIGSIKWITAFKNNA